MKKLLIGLIRLYQRAISANTPPTCRFTPTCSAYAIEAIQRFGAIRGTGLAVWRIFTLPTLGRARLRPGARKKAAAEENPAAAGGGNSSPFHR